jgi:hypothetical protein
MPPNFEGIILKQAMTVLSNARFALVLPRANPASALLAA